MYDTEFMGGEILWNKMFWMSFESDRETKHWVTDKSKIFPFILHSLSKIDER